MAPSYQTSTHHPVSASQTGQWEGPAVQSQEGPTFWNWISVDTSFSSQDRGEKDSVLGPCVLIFCLFRTPTHSARSPSQCNCFVFFLPNLSLYIQSHSSILGASLVAQMVKNLPVMQETLVWSLGWEDPLEEGMATRSSNLAGESHGEWSVVGYSP